MHQVLYHLGYIAVIFGLGYAFRGKVHAGIASASAEAKHIAGKL